MHSFRKGQWLMSCGALLTLMSAGCGAASANTFELVYRATLNEGSASLSGFIGQEPFPAGTSLTITAECDTSSANQWNTGAYIYSVLSATFLISALPAPPRLPEIDGSLLILLSDPSWAINLGPSPYSAGFISVGGLGLGSINSVFGASTAPFQAAEPSSTVFYDYQHNFDFTGRPLTVLLSGGVLTIYNSSVSDVTATLLSVPEFSSWGLMLVGFTGLAIRLWRTCAVSAAFELQPLRRWGTRVRWGAHSRSVWRKFPPAVQN